MLCCCVPADFADLINMVSISTLFAFWMVALALLWYRCIPAARNGVMSSCLLVLELAAMVAACIGNINGLTEKLVTHYSMAPPRGTIALQTRWRALGYEEHE